MVLEAVERGDAPLKDVLDRHGVPQRTYHNWRRRYPANGGDALDTIHALEQEIRSLRRENMQLKEALALQRELLGKPWRRPPPGGRPSDTSSDTPD